MPKCVLDWITNLVDGREDEGGGGAWKIPTPLLVGRCGDCEHECMHGRRLL